MSAREKKILVDDSAKLTEHLLTVLPKLLAKVFISHIRVHIWASPILYEEHTDSCAAQLDSEHCIMIMSIL